MLVIFVRGNVKCGKFLVAWLAEFVFRVEVYPKLKSQAVCFEAAGHFCMNDTLSSSHPLNVARTDDSMMALKILVVKIAF